MLYLFYKRNAMEKSIFSKLFPGNLKFWEKNQKVVGIDIGSSSVKVVQLRREKERAILETYGELATGPYVKRQIGQVVQLPEEVVVNMLKDLFKEASVTATSAAVSIPVKNTFIAVIDLPLVSEKEMDEMVRLEARKYVPVPIKEVEINWQIIGRSEEKADGQKNEKLQLAEILLVVIHKEVIQKYRGVVEKLGLKMKLIEAEVFSAWRSVIFRPVAPVIVIDMGASSAKMSIVDAGVLRSTYTIDKGSQMITDSISKSLNISFERAEELKREVGLSTRPEYKELASVMESNLNFIFSEAREFMLAYRKKNNKSVSQVFLTGGGAILNGVVDLAVKSLGVETLRADSFAKMDYPAFLQETLKKIGPSFSTASGLALKSLNHA
ncbi:MAG: hypothetical protein COT67_02530 [Candidatus Tagabacteria bacterium CG09_land_8_20_14_0_10_41_14]|uniref:SHS2 domain-containing protein n=2 Tax=Candidatus Tagaibacteriota TaxID=1817918 RepID=A0A2H0WKY3_9BACT|nr:MAG: hypothetical protein COT67_02530 [Candidatus Tagabacteria bacterium CG09_land_8_20_14_0_10_41_14]PJE73329.1 MAG: hypothetical protein COV00_00455 [Candidatus Tagabacteria bacterium CG10_big_fil_rev_8_21_14_0_10_40_13]